MSDAYAQAYAKVCRIQKSVSDERSAAFLAIMQADPWIVSQMQAHQQEFGKFSAVKIVVQVKTIYERGELLPVRYDKYFRGK